MAWGGCRGRAPHVMCDMRHVTCIACLKMCCIFSTHIPNPSTPSPPPAPPPVPRSQHRSPGHHQDAADIHHRPQRPHGGAECMCDGVPTCACMVVWVHACLCMHVCGVCVCAYVFVHAGMLPRLHRESTALTQSCHARRPCAASAPSILSPMLCVPMRMQRSGLRTCTWTHMVETLVDVYDMDPTDLVVGGGWWVRCRWRLPGCTSCCLPMILPSSGVVCLASSPEPHCPAPAVCGVPAPSGCCVYWDC